jgi:hypothetical protein
MCSKIGPVNRPFATFQSKLDRDFQPVASVMKLFAASVFSMILMAA